MRNLLAIARKDLRMRIRDRSVLITAFLAPLTLAFIFNIVFGSTFGAGGTFEASLGVVENDSPRTTGILQNVSASVGGTWAVFGNRAEAERAIDDGDADAVFLIPPGFDAGVEQGRAGELEVIGSVDASTSTQIATAIAQSYGLGVDQVQLSIATALASGGDPPTVIAAVTESPNAPLATLGKVTADIRQLDGTTSSVAAMAVFFLMFTSQVGLLSLLEERRDGTLSRILATPTRPRTVLAAKALVSVVLGLASLLVLIVAGRVLMGADWGNPAGVATLVLATCLAAVGISAITTGLANTPEAAGNMSGIVGTVLGLLGGVFFPVGEDGGLLARISALTPHHWFMRGLADLSGGQGAVAVLPAVGPLLVIALVTAVVASLLIRRQVSS
jgi:ABC-2 type transport system permease protein